jgi:TRAP-type mannitol/chloroaromatic compound transport system permease small subunit
MNNNNLLFASAVRALDALAEYTGTTTAWLTAAMVVIACIVVTLRHVFGIGAVALQESITFFHSMVFMLGAAYALKLGSLLFTLPLMIFIGWGSLDFVRESWRINEGSTDSGGLGGVYLLKSLLLVMAVSVSLQALAELLRALLVLMRAAPAGDERNAD